MRFVSAALAALALLALAATPAIADTVVIDGDNAVEFDDEGTESSTLVVTMTPGSITIAQEDGDTITPNSANCGAAPAATITCTDPIITGFDFDMQGGEDTVTVNGDFITPPFQFDGGRISGGEGVDRLTGSATNSYLERLDGGPGGDFLDTRDTGPAPPNYPFPFGDNVTGLGGDDVITTGSGHDFVDGDQFVPTLPPNPADIGADVITTGSGNDFVEPGLGDGDQVDLGTGDDTLGLEGGEDPTDSFAGGDGFDRLQLDSFTFNTPDAFSVDLTVGSSSRSGSASGTAPVTSFEDVITSRGADNVTGTDGPNLIDTSEGFGLDASDSVDLVTGDGGFGPADAADVVNPRGGSDLVFTGAGDDVIEARDGSADTVRCGDGNDSAQLDQLDSSHGCETAPITQIPLAGVDTDPPGCTVRRVSRSYARAAFNRGVTAAVDCDESVRVTAKLIVTLKGRTPLSARAGDLVLAERTVNAASGDTTVRLKPARKLVRRFGTRRGLKARVVVEARDTAGNPAAVTKRLSVKKAAKKKRRRR